MVLTNCNNDYLPLDTETAMQTNFYKNGNHQLNRQNASLNLLEFGAGNNNNVQHSSVLSSNGYYGFAAHHNVGQSVPAPGFLAQRSLQQQQASEATTDEEMSVDIEESGAAEKRKRFDEASWQPMETKRFRFASSYCVDSKGFAKSSPSRRKAQIENVHHQSPSQPRMDEEESTLERLFCSIHGSALFYQNLTDEY